MNWLGELLSSIAILLIALGAVYIVAFRILIRRPRGRDTEGTIQLTVQAKDARDAMHKAYESLSDEQQESVQGVFLERTQDMGDRQN